MTSFYDQSNRLEVSYTTKDKNGNSLGTIPLIFSESIPNIEQAQFLLDFVQAFEAVIAEKSKTATEGSIYWKENTLESSYKVISSTGEVLFQSTPSFSAAVSNVEQAEITALLASFAVSQASKA